MKIQEQWRNVQRLAKERERQAERLLSKENEEHTVQMKAAIIERLETTLHEGEEHYQLGLRSHMECVETLLEGHRSSLQLLREEFDLELQGLVKQWEVEKTELTTKHQDEKEELLSIIAAMEREFEDAETVARQEFQDLRDDIRSSNSEEMATLKAKLELRLQALMREHEQVPNFQLENQLEMFIFNSTTRHTKLLQRHTSQKENR